MISTVIDSGDGYRIPMGSADGQKQVDKALTIPNSTVREALNRMLAAKSLARSKRISSFLHYVVEETLEGRGDRLKAFTIAQDVYGRDETFDPRTDTIVRVEAGRLRQRLKHYDETEGRNDLVLINIPKGPTRRNSSGKLAYRDNTSSSAFGCSEMTGWRRLTLECRHLAEVRVRKKMTNGSEPPPLSSAKACGQLHQSLSVRVQVLYKL